jgi:diacylglycerol O-acyltransferase / trehalose O-mycolyltransferase
VMPDGGRVGFYSDWLNGPGWERFHTEELPQLLASRYRASDRRVVAGNSMGGLGALTYTARHPGLFAAAASFSGIVHTRLSDDESRSYLGLIDSEGEHPYAVWGAPTVDHQIWAAHNPYDLAQHFITTPLFISVGNGQPGPLNRGGGAVDRVEQALYAENVAFRARLTLLGAAAATFDFYGPGSHDWPYWQRELHRAWPLLTNALV